METHVNTLFFYRVSFIWFPPYIWIQICIEFGLYWTQKVYSVESDNLVCFCYFF